MPSWLAIGRSSVGYFWAGFAGLPQWLYLSSMGVWQQTMAPSPPLVTMNSEPHFAQTYR
ncbi:MAG: hypothetical protein V3S68_06965 [Dehalococcoidia bacterium]